VVPMFVFGARFIQLQEAIVLKGRLKHE